MGKEGETLGGGGEEGKGNVVIDSRPTRLTFPICGHVYVS